MILTVSPKKVILGGGVMKQRQMFPMIREEVKRILNGYVSADAVTENIEQYIVPPGLGRLGRIDRGVGTWSGSLAKWLKAPVRKLRTYYRGRLNKTEVRIAEAKVPLFGQNGANC